MTRRAAAALAGVLGLLAAGTGCVTYERGAVALAAPHPPPIPMETVAERVEGRTCGSFLERRYELAVDDALARAPGADALVDVHYRFERLCVVVEGRAVRVAPQGP